METLKGDEWFKLSTARAIGNVWRPLILSVPTIPHNREDHCYIIYVILFESNDKIILYDKIIILCLYDE